MTVATFPSCIQTASDTDKEPFPSPSSGCSVRAGMATTTDSLFNTLPLVYRKQSFIAIGAAKENDTISYIVIFHSSVHPHQTLLIESFSYKTAVQIA